MLSLLLNFAIFSCATMLLKAVKFQKYVKKSGFHGIQIWQHKRMREILCWLFWFFRYDDFIILMPQERVKTTRKCHHRLTILCLCCGPVLAVYNGLAKQTETYLGRPLLGQSLAIFEFSILNSCSRQLQIAALNVSANMYSIDLNETKNSK